MSALDGIITFSHSEYRLCEVDGKKALFHKWNDYSQVVEESPLIGGAPAGEIKYTLGLVEFENGVVDEVSPRRITFKDGLFAEKYKEQRVLE